MADESMDRNPSPLPGAASAGEASNAEDAIRECAYFIYTSRCARSDPGSPESDWYAAEATLRDRATWSSSVLTGGDASILVTGAKDPNPQTSRADVRAVDSPG